LAIQAAGRIGFGGDGHTAAIVTSGAGGAGLRDGSQAMRTSRLGSRGAGGDGRGWDNDQVGVAIATRVGWSPLTTMGPSAGSINGFGALATSKDKRGSLLSPSEMVRRGRPGCLDRWLALGRSGGTIDAYQASWLASPMDEAARSPLTTRCAGGSKVIVQLLKSQKPKPKPA
jgi:hypothetical protein